MSCVQFSEHPVAVITGIIICLFICFIIYTIDTALVLIKRAKGKKDECEIMNKKDNTIRRIGRFIGEIIALSIFGVYMTLSLLTCSIMTIAYFYCVIVAPEQALMITIAALSLGILLRIIIYLLELEINQEEDKVKKEVEE